MNSTTAPSPSPLHDHVPASAAPKPAAAARGLPLHPRHRAATIALHWGNALLLLASVAAALSRDLTGNDALRGTLLDIHRQTGLVVLLLLGARLAVRLRHGLADHAGRMHPLLRIAAHAAHIGLYGLLLALPLLGLATSQAHEHAVRLLGVLPLPTLVAGDPDLAETLSDWHIRAAWLLLGLVVAHVAAALWHHLQRRDGVLAAMLPLVRRRRAA